MQRISKLLSLALLGLFINLNAFAESEIYTDIFSNTAVGGYDSVAYFTQGQPVKGESKFKTTYKNNKWLFSSQKNLDLFIADPQKYAPQYGGYCAWAVGHNTTAKGDPQHWTILDDKLYLNYNKDIQSKWLVEPKKWITEADKNWSSLLK